MFASGLRNPVGLAWQPDSGGLWVSVNERDELGDHLPPDYMTALKDGAFYGFPYSYFGQHVDDRVKPQNPQMVAKAISPDYALGAHTASLGLAFNTGNLFPPEMGNGAFVGQHGSWNRTVPVGARLMVTFLKEDGHVAGPSIPFADGWNDNGHYLGRPVDVQQYWDGSLLVSDDLVGAVYRIWYDGK